MSCGQSQAVRRVRVRGQVDALRSDQQGTAPGLAAAFLFPALVGDEVGTYEVVVLTAKRACAELARGRALGGRERRVVSVPWVEATSSRTWGDTGEQRFEEAGDEAEHGVTP